MRPASNLFDYFVRLTKSIHKCQHCHKWGGMFSEVDFHAQFPESFLHSRDVEGTNTNLPIARAIIREVVVITI